MFKSTRNLISLYVAIAIFCTALIVLFVILRYSFNFPEEVAKIPIDVLITLLAASLAGVFTLLGVDITMKGQSKLEFINKFPLKIFHLDNMLEEINALEKKITNGNAPFLILEQNFFQSLMSTATEVDGYIYYRTRECHVKFSSKIKEMFLDELTAIYIQDEWGQWILKEGNEREAELSITEINKIVEDIKIIIQEYRSNFINHYDKNIEATIFKKIRV